MKAILDPRGNPARLTVKAQYEAAVYSPTRSGVWWPLRDAAGDADGMTRHETARLGWHLWQNSPTARGLIERLVIFTIGTGIHPFAAGSDPKWNEAADVAWENDSESMELTSGLCWTDCQDIAARGMLVGGDSLSVPVDIPGDMPRLALFESQDIGPHRLHKDATDGVKVDAIGRSVGYVRAKTGDLYPSDLASLHYLPERANQRRGVSVLATATNTARDLDDILKFEKDSVAENSRTTEVIESATGDAPSLQSLYQGATVTLEDGTTRAAYYKKVLGSAPKILTPGDKWIEKRSDRPSAAWQGFVLFLCECICLSTGIPASLVLGSKIGGADTRRETAIGERVVERWQRRIARQFYPHWRRWIRLRIEDGTLSGEPDNWHRCEFQFPKAMTVDAGREAKNDRDDVAAGLLTEQEFHGRYSNHWLKHRKQVQTEARDKIKRAKWLAADEDIPFELALSMLGHTDDSPQVEPAPQPQAPMITQ